MHIVEEGGVHDGVDVVGRTGEDDEGTRGAPVIESVLDVDGVEGCRVNVAECAVEGLGVGLPGLEGGGERVEGGSSG